MNQIIEADAAKLAGLQIDILQKVRQNKIGMDHLEWFTRLKPDVRGALMRGEYVLTKVAVAVTVTLLMMAGTVSVPATIKNFVASEKFVINTTATATVKIHELSTNFKEWFLKKVEASFAGSELRYQKLVTSSSDTPVISELGGKKKAETTLTEMFFLMEKQGHGQDGDLLINGLANIFYIRDVNSVLRCVCLYYWCGDGWDVYADSTTDPRDWSVDSRVFSRNSDTV